MAIPLPCRGWSIYEAAAFKGSESLSIPLAYEGQQSSGLVKFSASGLSQILAREANFLNQDRTFFYTHRRQ